MLLGRLRGLNDLTLAFEGNNDNGSPVWIGPLAQLTNLQRLVVQGVVPSAAAAGAAVEGGGGPNGEHGSVSISNSCGFLPNSLTSLEIQGRGWDDRGEGTTTVKDWMDHIRSGNQLQELRVLHFSSDASGSLFDQVHLGRLSLLKRLHVLMEAASGIGVLGWVPLPLSLTSLSNLELLEISSNRPELPGPQYFFVLGGQGQLGLLNHLPKLRKLGWVLHPQHLEVPAAAQLSQLEELRFYGEVPAWLTASMCPQLQTIMVEGRGFSGAMQRLAGLTQLTALRLDGGVAHAESSIDGWGDMRVLAHSLHRLRRLELVNYANDLPEEAEGVDDEQLQELAMPDLSAFTQIKQLQLVALMDPDSGIPGQPSCTEFLQGLSKLTQLEQLQLEGYSTVTPAMVSFLVQILPQLQLLEVGLCKHPELEEEMVRGKDAISWEELHPGFKDVQQLCKLVKAKLQVMVGYACQWL